MGTTSRADGSNVAENSDLTVSEWCCAAATISAVGTGLALLAAGLWTDDHSMSMLGALLFVSILPLSWIFSAIEIRAGRAERDESWGRQEWVRTALRGVVSAGVGALVWGVFACAGGARRGLLLGLGFAVAGPAAHLVGSLAWRVLGRPTDYVPRPTAHIISPMPVRSWTTGAVFAGGATTGMAGAAAVTSSPSLAAATVVLFVATVLAGWRRRKAVLRAGPPRRVVS